MQVVEAPIEVQVAEAAVDLLRSLRKLPRLPVVLKVGAVAARWQVEAERQVDASPQSKNLAT